MPQSRLLGALAIALGVASVSLSLSGPVHAATKTTKKATRPKTTTTKAAPVTAAPTTAPAPVTTAPAPVTTAPASVPAPKAPSDADSDAELRFGVLGTPRTLDPHKFFTAADWYYMYPVFDRLTTIDDQLLLKPMLATSWRFAADGKSLELKLRPGVVFQDGSPLNAAAVKANIERGLTVSGSTVVTNLAPIASVEAPDDVTVKINLKAPGGALPITFAGAAGMIVNPKAFGRDLTNGPGDGGGSGAYRVTSFRAAESAAYERVNFKYWDPSANLLKAFRITFTNGSAGALNGVKAGDYDLAQVSGTDVEVAQKDVQARRIKGIESLQIVTQNVMFIRSERNPGAVGNRFIRQAIGYAINRNDIVGGLFNGNGRAATTYYPPDHWAFSARAAAFYTFNQSRARSLIEQSGISRPAVRITYAQGQTVDPISQVIAQQLRDVGFEVTLNPQPAAQASAPFQQGTTDIFVGQVSGVTNVDPANYLAAYFLPNATSGVQVYSDPDGAFAKAIAAAGDPSLTNAERAKIYEPIFVKIAEEGYIIPINNQLQMWARSASKNIEDKIAFRWSGLPDFRSVYVSK